MSLLHTGDRFPEIKVHPAGTDTIVLPDALSGSYGVVLFYRGSWCPYCRGQLRAFQQAQDKFAEAGTKVIALSVDDETTTLETIRKLGLTFPVGHSAEPYELAYATGAFVHERPTHLESTGFVLDPEGHVVVSVYSTNAIGRLVPEDVLGIIEYTRQNRQK